MSRRSHVAAAIAIVLHVAGYAGLRSRPLDARVPASPLEDEVEVSILAGAPVEVAAALAIEAKHAAPAPAPRVVERGPAGSPAPADGSPEPAPPSPPGSPISHFAPMPLGVAVGGGTNPFLARGALPPDAKKEEEPHAVPDAKAAERSLREGIGSRVDRGLGPEGPVIHALRDAAYAGFSPVVGSATFVVVVDAGGAVVELRLAGSSPRTSDAARGWEDARRRAAEALARAKLPLRGARGAELRIEVASDLRLPSGNGPKGPPVQPAFSASRISLPPGSPASGLSASDDWHTNTIATFDISDVGAKARRVVRTRVVSAREL